MAVGGEGELEAGGDFLLDLVLRAVDVGVVLVEMAHAEQAVERAARFVAVQQTRL